MSGIDLKKLERHQQQWTPRATGSGYTVSKQKDKNLDLEGPQCDPRPMTHSYQVKIQYQKKQVIFIVHTRSMKRAIKAGELRAVRYLDSYKKDLARSEEGSIRTVRKPDPSPFQMIIECLAV